MKKILILGNGFDLSHCIPSSYNDFKEYLEYTYVVKKDPYPLITSNEGNTGEIIISPYESAKLMVYGMNTTSDYITWSKFEEDLPKMDFSFLQPNEEDYTDKEGDPDIFYYDDILSRYYDDFSYNIAMWRSLFNDWITEVNDGIKESECFKTNKKIKSVLDDNTCVLTFNYTETIELVYNFDNVIHIHNKIGEDLVWGHGDKQISLDCFTEFDSRKCNIMVNNMYKKNVHDQIKKYKSFFDSLDGDIVQIYSFGFEYSEVDYIYIEEIIKRISPNSKWILNDYDGSFSRHKKIIEDLGFKGKIIIWEEK